MEKDQAGTAFRRFLLASALQVVRHPVNSIQAMLLIPMVGGGIVVIMLVQQVRVARRPAGRFNG